MSLYADYLAERTTDRIIENESGFVTYRYINDGQTVYIVDIYTVKDARQKGVGTFLAEIVADEARENGCKEMIGTVVPSTKGSTTSLMVLIAYGFKLKSAGNDFIIFTKEL